MTDLGSITHEYALRCVLYVERHQGPTLVSPSGATGSQQQQYQRGSSSASRQTAATTTSLPVPADLDTPVATASKPSGFSRGLAKIFGGSSGVSLYNASTDSLPAVPPTIDVRDISNGGDSSGNVQHQQRSRVSPAPPSPALSTSTGSSATVQLETLPKGVVKSLVKRITAILDDPRNRETMATGGGGGGNSEFQPQATPTHPDYLTLVCLAELRSRLEMKSLRDRLCIANGTPDDILVVYGEIVRIQCKRHGIFRPDEVMKRMTRECLDLVGLVQKALSGEWFVVGASQLKRRLKDLGEDEVWFIIDVTSRPTLDGISSTTAKQASASPPLQPGRQQQHQQQYQQQQPSYLVAAPRVSLANHILAVLGAPIERHRTFIQQIAPVVELFPPPESQSLDRSWFVPPESNECFGRLVTGCITHDLKSQQQQQLRTPQSPSGTPGTSGTPSTPSTLTSLSHESGALLDVCATYWNIRPERRVACFLHALRDLLSRGTIGIDSLPIALDQLDGLRSLRPFSQWTHDDADHVASSLAFFQRTCLSRLESTLATPLQTGLSASAKQALNADMAARGALVTQIISRLVGAIADNSTRHVSQANTSELARVVSALLSDVRSYVQSGVRTRCATERLRIIERYSAAEAEAAGGVHKIANPNESPMATATVEGRTLSAPEAVVCARLIDELPAIFKRFKAEYPGATILGVPLTISSNAAEALIGTIGGMLDALLTSSAATHTDNGVDITVEEGLVLYNSIARYNNTYAAGPHSAGSEADGKLPRITFDTRTWLWRVMAQWLRVLALKLPEWVENTLTMDNGIALAALVGPGIVSADDQTQHTSAVRDTLDIVGQQVDVLLRISWPDPPFRFAILAHFVRIVASCLESFCKFTQRQFVEDLARAPGHKNSQGSLSGAAASAGEEGGPRSSSDSRREVWRQAGSVPIPIHMVPAACLRLNNIEALRAGIHRYFSTLRLDEYDLYMAQRDGSASPTLQQQQQQQHGSRSPSASLVNAARNGTLSYTLHVQHVENLVGRHSALKTVGGTLHTPFVQLSLRVAGADQQYPQPAYLGQPRPSSTRYSTISIDTTITTNTSLGAQSSSSVAAIPPRQSKSLRPLVIGKTRRIRDGLNLSWCEDFTLPIDDVMAPYIVDVEIYEKDGFFSGDVLCARGTLEIPPLSDINDVLLEKWVQMSPRGRFLVRVSCPPARFRDDLRVQCARAVRALYGAEEDMRRRMLEPMIGHFRRSLCMDTLFASSIVSNEPSSSPQQFSSANQQQQQQQQQQLPSYKKGSSWNPFARNKKKQVQQQILLSVPGADDAHQKQLARRSVVSVASTDSFHSDELSLAMKPVLRYLEEHLGVIYHGLYSDVAARTLSAIWEELLMTIDDLVLPTLRSSRIGDVNPHDPRQQQLQHQRARSTSTPSPFGGEEGLAGLKLTGKNKARLLSDSELLVVNRVLALLYWFFNGGDDQDGFPIERLDTAHYRALLDLQYLYMLPSSSLMAEYRKAVDMLRSVGRDYIIGSSSNRNKQTGYQQQDTRSLLTMFSAVSINTTSALSPPSYPISSDNLSVPSQSPQQQQQHQQHQQQHQRPVSEDTLIAAENRADLILRILQMRHGKSELAFVDQALAQQLSFSPSFPQMRPTSNVYGMSSIPL
ncbi:hypothetical protein GQ42DRAFT_23242 [Ramicandelaber brevisporus]|nr:hypothetical protein GQ42DRAFT_23242 [Ramicandelaber brevisporus]